MKVLTPLDSPYSGGIGLFRWRGSTWSKLGGWLLGKTPDREHEIVHPEFTGLRITPNVYTTLDEIDMFAEKVLEAMKKGIA